MNLRDEITAPLRELGSSEVLLRTIISISERT